MGTSEWGSATMLPWYGSPFTFGVPAEVELAGPAPAEAGLAEAIPAVPWPGCVPFPALLPPSRAAPGLRADCPFDGACCAIRAVAARSKPALRARRRIVRKATHAVTAAVDILMPQNHPH